MTQPEPIIGADTPAPAPPAAEQPTPPEADETTPAAPEDEAPATPPTEGYQLSDNPLVPVDPR